MKLPQQERSRNMVEAIITAATRILSTDEDIKFTTNAVAEIAGVSVGSLYQYFPNKEALIEEISRRHEAQLIAKIRDVGDVAAGTTIRETVTLFVRAHVMARSINPALYNALIVHNSERSEDAWFSEYKAELIRSVAEHLSHRPRTVGLEGLDKLAFVLFSAVDGTVSAAMKEQRNLFEDGTIETHLTLMITAYLVELTGHPADV